MKKRLLSAALALAMVLTLLPATIVPAFAADWTTQSGNNLPSGSSYNTTGTPSQTLQYYRANANSTTDNPSYTTVTVSLCTATNSDDGRVYGHWYWQKNQGTDAQAPKYMEVQSGIITGTGTSGQWYSSVADYQRTAANGDKTINGAFTVLGNGAVDLSSYKNSSLTINFANSTSSLTLPSTLTSLTISAKYEDSSTTAGVFDQGAVGAISIDRSQYSQTGVNTGLTVNANNIDIASINLSGRANTLNLTDCKVGAITLNGETMTTQAAVTANTPNAWSAQAVTTNNCTLSGAINITNSDGGGVTLNNTLGGQAVNFTGNSGNIRVTGYSNVGLITVEPRTNAGSYASVSITGGTVTGVTQSKGTTTVDKPMTITVSGSTTKFGTINADINGTVSITDADGTAVTVDKGSLTISGRGVDITGDVTLAADGATRLTMNASNSTFGGVKSTAGNNLTIPTWNGNRYRDGGNKYGVLALGTYDGRQVTGGTFAQSISSDLGGANALKWLDMNNLLFYVDNGSEYDLYTKTELARAISDITTANASQTGKITVLGQATGKKDLILMNGKNEWAKIGYNSTTPLILPEMINGMTITKWYAPSNHNIEFNAGKEEGVPALGADLILNSTGSVNTAVNKITKATTTASTGSDPVVNQNVTVTLNGNNINVTGAVIPGAGGVATVKVDLETDVVDEAGTPITIEGVVIDCFMKDGRVTKAQFNSIQPESASDVGVVVINGELVMNLGTGAHYTVTASVTESASRLGIVPDGTLNDSIVVTFGMSLTQQQKDAYAKDIADGGQFTYGLNQAMQQALNAAQSTITSNNSVQGWITNAQNTIWRNGFKSPNQAKNTNYGYAANMAPNAGTFNGTTASGSAILSAFDKAYIVPYLAINVTQYDPAGTLTATLTPSYRVDVSASGGYDKDMAYTVQTGRPLTLTGSMTNVPVTVKLGTNAATNFANKYMHQDGKYVYTGATATWKITHLGANGTLGTVVINGNDGLVSIDGNATDAIVNRTPALTGATNALACKYDTVQAAIDDTVRGSTVQTEGGTFDPAAETMDTVVIDGQYKGNDAITMTGMSRKVKVIANGQQTVTATGNVEVNKIGTQSTGGYVYTVELKQDAVVAGTVVLAVQATNQGTIALPANSAKAGQTVTVTVVPTVAGQVAKGVTVKTNDGTLVPATATGRTNEFSFVVPKNTTSITVSPNFAVTTATFAVNNTSQGTALANTGTADNTAQQGSTVPVTVYPNSGYRTVGLTVRTNTGATVMPTRTGTNTYSVTVPAGATIVTVTPSFDYNTGTLFTDVLSTDWASKYVTWAYQNNYIQGTSTYTYSPKGYMTHGEVVSMLYKAAGSPSVAGMSSPFVDIGTSNATYWAHDAVVWAYNRGLISAGTGYFNPYTNATRAEIVEILYKRAGSPAVYGTSGFADVANNASYARAVTWARQKGLTNGYGGKTYFRPGYAVSRAEMATFLGRAFGNMT